MGETPPKTTFSKIINAATTPAIIAFFFLLFWVVFACIRAIVRANKRKTSFFAEIKEGETWKIYRMKELTLSMCKSKYSSNCFSTAEEAHAVFPCLATTDETEAEGEAAGEAEGEAEGETTEAYTLRPLPLDEPTVGKPMGCNL